MKQIHVVAAVIRDRRGRILLARRTQERDLAGLWEFPGGKREPGETSEAALVRELQEELGIEAEVGELFPKSDWIRLNHRVIWHGRRRCHARRPACGACSVASYCPSFGEGPTDPKVAAKLVREPRG